MTCHTKLKPMRGRANNAPVLGEPDHDEDVGMIEIVAAYLAFGIIIATFSGLFVGVVVAIFRCFGG